MKIDEITIIRLNELIEMGERVKGTRHSRSSESVTRSGMAVDNELASQWGMSCLNILNRVFGPESDHYTKFNQLYPNLSFFGSMKGALGILKSAKEEVEKGLLFSTRTLVIAEVFDDFLEQAEHLLSSGYYQAAAVLVGCVLEDGLRRLCARKNVHLPAKAKLDSMNSELAKIGTYNLLVQKRITMLAEIRNKAAHGQSAEFDQGDVADMLQKVRSFMEDYLT